MSILEIVAIDVVGILIAAVAAGHWPTQKVPPDALYDGSGGPIDPG